VKHNILLIDDSKFIRKANELALNRAGFAVSIAGDGEEGLRVALEKVPDLIILDLLLPKLSGPELLHKLKEDARTASIPVIVLSSLAQRNEEKLKSEGAVAYFEKAALGIDQGSSGLVQVVERFLRPKKASSAAAPRPR
jgi:DNA-binding response OmpR family regulator